MKKIAVKCPHCKKQFNYYESNFRPFCSERCKLIDLGHWLTGSYSVPSNTPLSDDDIEAVLKEQQDPEES
jgi:endogenous inhibitor of DNA gyrase (YacG/DUF329 family)